MRGIAALMVVVVIVLGAGGAWALRPAGERLGDVVLVDTAGHSRALASMIKGKVGVIIYWSVTCGHCAQQLPGILGLLERWKGNKGLVVVSVSADAPDMAPAIEAYARGHGLPVPVIVDAPAGGTRAVLAEALDIVATPAVVVVDCKGTIAFIEEMDIDLKALARAVRSCMLSCAGQPGRE